MVLTVNKVPQDPTALFTARVNVEKRRSTENNHSAAHILHLALQKVLGSHVEQKGSLVTPERLRFDFSHFQKMSNEEIIMVEDTVNQIIRQNTPLQEHREMPIEKAKEMGAMALFGEKYGDSVRVIRFGDSIELCGGTHAKSTGQLGLFIVTSESAIAAGIRRIEGITGQAAIDYMRGKFAQLAEAQSLLKSPTNLTKGIESLLETNLQLQKQLDEVEKEKAKVIKSQLIQKIKKHNNINVLAEVIETNASGLIKDLCFQLKNEISDLYCVLGAAVDGKAMLGVAVSENITKEHDLHAGNIIRELAKEVDGGGGGQPFFATAGGKNPANLEKAIEKALTFLK